MAGFVLLIVAMMSLAPSASADPISTSCATAASHWSPPIAVSRDALRARRVPRGVPGPFDIVIQPGSGLVGNAAALAAWDRAAAEWEAIISDPVTVTVEADLVDLGEPNVLGQTDAVLLTGTVGEIRDPMAQSAVTEADEGITAALPTAAELELLLAPGAVFPNLMIATKANLKALGATDLDAQLGARDARIDFNSAFTFDFDRADGTAPGTIDFQSVAAHELGHALGFFSGVDFVDQGLIFTVPTPLDLFRFPDGSADDPTTTVQFTAARRSLRPGSPDVFDDLTVEHRMSTGFDRGDGRQASHWKDDQLTGVYVGLMDPTRSPRTILELTEADARAMDLIGWDLVTNGTTTSSVTVTSTTSTTSTTLPPECFEDATCVDADPCTRDFCANPVCVHAPVLGPADVRVLVPVVANLEGCDADPVPGALEKRARQLGAVLDRAERTSKPNRERTLLGRAGRKVDRVLRKATALADDGRLDAGCVSALETRMDEVRTALDCVLGGS